MEWVRAHWKVLLAVTVVAAIALTVLEPGYITLQMSTDAPGFRQIDYPQRATLAALIDIVFAVGYGALGVAGLRAVAGRTTAATLGSIAIAVGALFDEIENVLLIRNIANRDDLTDGWVDAMHVPGALKWIATPGFLLLFGLLIAQRVRARRT
jgi:hypothetical protein